MLLTATTVGLCAKLIIIPPIVTKVPFIHAGRVAADDADSAEDVADDPDAAVDEEEDDEDEVLVEEEQARSTVCVVIFGRF